MNLQTMERLLGGEGSVDLVGMLARKDLPAIGGRSIKEMIEAPRLVEGGAITASGYYGLTLEKQLVDTAAQSLESETAVKVAMVQDGYTPNFDTHDFRDDLTNEVSGTGYSSGGTTLTSTELTLSSGVLTYDAADVSWASSTITSAMAAVGYFNVGSAATDMLIWLSDFVTAASTTNGTFSIQWSASGIFTVDVTP